MPSIFLNHHYLHTPESFDAVNENKLCQKNRRGPPGRSTSQDTPNRYQFTPIIDIRQVEFIKVLNTIVTEHAFSSIESATWFGLGLSREWVDERLSPE
jgi:hypothetical protein